ADRDRRGGPHDRRDWRAAQPADPGTADPAVHRRWAHLGPSRTGRYGCGGSGCGRPPSTPARGPPPPPRRPPARPGPPRRRPAPGVGAATGPGGAARGMAGPAAVPAMVAHAGDTWLALGQHVAWTSPDGKVWQPAPGVPAAPGDTVLGLTGTGTGFVAVGAHTGSQPRPVVWTSADGPARRRGSGPPLRLTPPTRHVAALRWVASRDGVIVAGGQIPAGRGHRVAADLWRSTDGGRTWGQATLPVRHGATRGLAGLAANGTTFLAVRPGRTGAGHQDA